MIVIRAPIEPVGKALMTDDERHTFTRRVSQQIEANKGSNVSLMEGATIDSRLYEGVDTCVTYVLREIAFMPDMRIAKCNVAEDEENVILLEMENIRR